MYLFGINGLRNIHVKYARKYQVSTLLPNRLLARFVKILTHKFLGYKI